MDFAIDKQKGRFDILDYDLPTKDIDFCFVPHVNRAPMWLNRSLFLEKLKHIDFDFAPFQFDDVELCLRTWLNGCQVGWYKTGFSSLSAGGCVFGITLLRKSNVKRIYVSCMTSILIKT